MAFKHLNFIKNVEFESMEFVRENKKNPAKLNKYFLVKYFRNIVMTEEI